MGMEEALLARLRGATALADLVGDRIDWFDRPRTDDNDGEATLPAISLTLIDPGEEWTHDGPDGLDEARVRAECWGEDKSAVMAVKRALRAEMRAARDADGWRFHPGDCALERSDVDQSNDAGSEDRDAAPLFRVTMDFTFYHEELAS